MMKPISIVIPAYNEGERLPVKAFCDYLQTHPDVAFVLVNDGSKDATLERFEEIRKAFPEQAEVLNFTKNSGKAEAVRQGMLAAQSKADLVGFWDADLATPLEEIDEFAREFEIRPSLDICCGCRLERLGADIQRRNSRHCIGRVIATFISHVLGVPFYDTQCGAKMFRSACVKPLLEEKFLTRWLFDVEILYRYISIHGRAEAAGRILEYPLHQWHEVAGSKLSWRSSFRIFRELFRIWRMSRRQKTK